MMKKILIVDDGATIRLFFRMILEEAGYAVEEAINGIEALEKALVSAFDLLIVDVNMPKLDGYGFLREFRDHSQLLQVPAIMVSTEEAGLDQDLAFAAGANDYLVKPVKPEELLLHVRLLLKD
jgi:two-component system chemotaxis response regulator CheY